MAMPRVPVPGRQFVQRLCDFLGTIAHDRVTPDEIRIRVDQDRVVILQTAHAVQIEEHRAAANERFNVSAELSRVITAKLREQLAFAAGPFQ
jgi:hypothetical protein